MYVLSYYVNFVGHWPYLHTLLYYYVRMYVRMQARMSFLLSAAPWHTRHGGAAVLSPCLK